MSTLKQRIIKIEQEIYGDKLAIQAAYKRLKYRAKRSFLSPKLVIGAVLCGFLAVPRLAKKSAMNSSTATPLIALLSMFIKNHSGWYAMIQKATVLTSFLRALGLKGIKFGR